MNKPEKKSILSECAYQGGGIPKKYIKERSNFIDGYNQACEDWEKYHTAQVFARKVADNGKGAHSDNHDPGD